MAHKTKDLKNGNNHLATSDKAIATLDYWLASKCWRGKMGVGDKRGPDTMGELLEEAQRLSHHRGYVGSCAAALLEEVIEGETGYDKFLKTQERRTKIAGGLLDSLVGKEAHFTIADGRIDFTK